MYPEYDKAIYIDSDIVVPGDISELYDTDMHGNLIGVCKDSSVNDAPELQRYMTESLGLKLGDYFNSGMLLMNMKALREAKLAEHFLYLLNKYHFDGPKPILEGSNFIPNSTGAYKDFSDDVKKTDSKSPFTKAWSSSSQKPAFSKWSRLGAPKRSSF